MTYYLTLPSEAETLYNYKKQLYNQGFKTNSDQTCYFAEVEVPGFNKSNLSIEIKEDEGAEYVAIEGERNGAKYGKEIWIPNECDSSELKASIGDGILTLNLPIRKKTNLRKIKID